ncbi:MAG: DUF3488 and transglutaminase-like domain-containing protein, partial [Zoogloeaceae bacterium]|nr:DUF3488 and transglutaminase-like domain-containing protein [Zoogloeaceae bacterium]
MNTTTALPSSSPADKRQGVVSDEYLPHREMPWLLVIALVTTLPHLPHLPRWLGAAILLTLVFVVWRWRRGYRIIRASIRVPLVLVGAFLITLQYLSPLGQESCVALLVLLINMKLTELKSRRDITIVISLGYFLLLTHYFYSQDFFTGLWLLASVLIVTAALLHVHDAPDRPLLATLKTATRLLLQALPLMLILYVLFPRVEGPLWGVPSSSSRLGLSGRMSPGFFSQLASNNEIAFRVQFADPPPPPRQLYWRGPVLTYYDGQTWETEDYLMQPPEIETRGQPIRYVLTLEAHNRNWLLPLEMPTEFSGLDNIAFTRNGLLRSARPIAARTRLEFTSYPEYRMDARGLSFFLQRTNLQLPSGYNPRSLELARRWREETPDPRQLAERILRHFHDEPFYYTLEPPLLGANAIDDFLFGTRQGFCEHYAATFVTLMRAAGTPARVVTGYLGGEYNPIDNFFTVRQSAAHAWTEIWIEKEGWLRIDPTAAIHPARVSAETGANVLDIANQRALDWLVSMRYRWEAFNNRWDQWVLGYTSIRQRELLARLGLGDFDWKKTLLLLSACLILAIPALAFFVLRRRKPRLDPALAIWRAACKSLARQGIPAPSWETPLTLAARLEQSHPALAPAVTRLARLICAARYGRVPPP